MSPCEELNCFEIEITTQVWKGRTNPEIAAELCVSEQVIKNHLRNIFDKLGVWTRLELALYVASHGGRRWADHLLSRARASALCDVAGSGNRSRFLATVPSFDDAAGPIDCKGLQHPRTERT